jgi:hypothetical protein
MLQCSNRRGKLGGRWRFMWPAATGGVVGNASWRCSASGTWRRRWERRRPGASGQGVRRSAGRPRASRCALIPGVAGAGPPPPPHTEGATRTTILCWVSPTRRSRARVTRANSLTERASATVRRRAQPRRCAFASCRSARRLDICRLGCDNPSRALRDADSRRIPLIAGALIGPTNPNAAIAHSARAPPTGLPGAPTPDLARRPHLRPD